MTIRRFKLPTEFLDSYRDRPVEWGFGDAAGNSLGEVTFLRSYSRKKDDGSKETWPETCQRVIEGMFTVQREHCRRQGLPWDYKKAQRTAQDAYERMFVFKWLPAGRGIANMGAPFIVDDWCSLPLMNCAFVSTKSDFADAMHFLMLASMNGVGVGFDTAGAGRHTVKGAADHEFEHIVPDTREGWAEALRLIVDVYLTGTPKPVFDFSQVRPKGSPIKRFGGTASGPEVLDELLTWVSDLLESRVGAPLSATDIVDIANRIGTCVVSGSSRRSAELALGPQTGEYMDLKDYSVNPERAEWGWMSNNSVFAEVGQDYSEVASRTRINGEPGYVWMDTTRGFGRLKDPRDDRDHRAAGYNPCLTGDSLLLTATGWRRFDSDEAQSGDQDIVVDGRVTYTPSEDGAEHPENWTVDLSGHEPVTLRSSAVFLTQRDADIVKVSTSNGMDVRLTPDHLVATKRGMVAAGDLRIGEDEVLVTRGHLPSDRLGECEDAADVDRGEVLADGFMHDYLSDFEADELLANATSRMARIFVGWVMACVARVDTGPLTVELERDKAQFLQLMMLANGVTSIVDAESGDLVVCDPAAFDQAFLTVGESTVADVVSGGDVTTVTAVVPDGVEDVYCLREDSRRILCANGLTMRRCAEQPLESYEVCNLVETFPMRHESVDDYLKTLKVAYLYGKSVTLLPTGIQRTDSIQLRNRRIGMSQSGITTYVETHGIARWRELCDAGYAEVQRLDEVYSDWLCVRNSIRTTTVKPSGSVSILTGDSPGVHWNPAARYYIRRITMAPSVLLTELERAGYPVEESAYSPGQFVVSFPVESPFARSEREVSIWEKVAMAAEAQHWWSDNSVSVTISYDQETEGRHIESILSLYEGRLKTVSFLPLGEAGYAQMPYEEISAERYEEMTSALFPLLREAVYAGGEDAEVEKFCESSSCETKTFINDTEHAA